MKKIVIIVAIFIAIVAWIYVFQSSNKTTTIQQGDTVTIKYQATLPDGRVFNNSEQETIVIGEDTIPWIDAILIGQQSGSIIQTTITATQWYGKYYDPNKLQRMPIYTLTQAGITPEQWKFILLGGTRYYIQAIENDVVTLDTNPEHTRQDLNYTIQIIGREKQ